VELITVAVPVTQDAPANLLRFLGIDYFYGLAEGCDFLVHAFRQNYPERVGDEIVRVGLNQGQFINGGVADERDVSCPVNRRVDGEARVSIDGLNVDGALDLYLDGCPGGWDVAKARLIEINELEH